MQVLHHAYCYDLEHVLLLAGDRGANVISGTWVRFNSDMTEVYGCILDTVYELCLNWAYDESVALPDELDEVLDAAANKNQITRDEFEMNLKVWRQTMKLRLPIPRTARIIPRVFAEWNVKKGGSDTVTKLIDSVYVGPPILGSQAVLVSRYFMLYGVQRHQLRKIGSSDNVEGYVTVEAYSIEMRQRNGLETCARL